MMSLLRDRFNGGLGELMQRFSSSLQLDLQMLDEDIQGSTAHAQMLGETGIISKLESTALCDGLARVREDLASGAWVPGDEFEDVHMAVEARLSEILGEIAGKLHTARSRNDQVATDLRLWLKTRLRRLDSALINLLRVLLDRVESDGSTLLPGFTHLQRGQPILFGHHLLAYAWPLSRDLGRVRDASHRFDECPLGACAMAGTSFPIDRHRTAELLGFRLPTENAMDSVAARDHVQEVAAACSILSCNLSRMAEELVLWSSTEFAFVRLSDTCSTGSSIMPQKRNPDAAELVRGKSATVLGCCTTLLALPRSQPLAYNRDMQQDREALFVAVDTTIDCILVMTEVWRDLSIDSERYEADLIGDPCLATEVADDLTRGGLPFRTAHSIAARLVRRCESLGCTLDDLAEDQLEAVHAGLAEVVSRVGSPRDAAERRRSHGGSSSSEIARQVDVLRELTSDTQG